MTQSPQTSESAEPGLFQYVAIALGWLVPGLGHLLIGEKARGIVFIVTIHGLFAAGMLLGGIRAINPPDQALWSYTQFLAGWPMIVANKIERRESARLKAIEENYVSPHSRQRPNVMNPELIEERRAAGKELQAREPGMVYLPKVQDIGAVYCGIAGMLNLLVVFDALLRVTKTERQPENPQGAGS